MKKFEKTIFITGASSGIGREIALKLAQKGYKVFAGIRKRKDKELLESVNKNITGVYIDITDSESINKAFWFVFKNTMTLDVLINNAGIVEAGPIECIDIKRLKEQFNVNTFGAIGVVQKFMPLLKDSKIINISSMASFGLFPYISPYCASKRALDILFNSFLLENKSNIKVISVKPASIKTPIWNKSICNAKKGFEKYTDSIRKKYSKELNFLEQNALKNNSKALDVSIVVDKVVKIIEMKNPKSSYTVGKQAFWAQVFSLFPQDFVNLLIKLKLKNIY